MALKKCRECRKEISTSAKTCPNCGKRNPTSSVLGPIFTGVVLLVLIIWWIGKQPRSDPQLTSPASEPSLTDLKAAVWIRDGNFIVKNGDSFDWQDVELEVNSKVWSGGYTLKVPVIHIGETFTVSATELSNGDGIRFNPVTMKAQKITIWCKTPKGVWSGENKD